MTIFAVMAAGLYPALHVGRIWFAFWLFPVPGKHGACGPNFKSPLCWDVFARLDLRDGVDPVLGTSASCPTWRRWRDRAQEQDPLDGVRPVRPGLARPRTATGSTTRRAYLILAGLSTPRFVLSVHTIVSFDFARLGHPRLAHDDLPALLRRPAPSSSGFAMVMTLMIVARRAFHLEDLITVRHLENMNKIIMATGTMVGYAYGMEFFIAWYSGNQYETFTFINRAMGPYAWAYWTMVSCNVFLPQLFWFKKCRTSIPIMFRALDHREHRHVVRALRHQS